MITAKTISEGASLQGCRCQAIILLIDSDKPLFREPEFDAMVKEVLADVKAGKLSAERIYRPPTGWKADRVVAFPVSLYKNCGPIERVEAAFSNAVNYCKNRGWHDLLVLLNCKHSYMERIFDSLFLSQYSFAKYKSSKENGHKKDNLTVTFALPKDGSLLVREREVVAAAVNGARDIVNEPANVANIDFIAEVAKRVAKVGGLKLSVLNEKELISRGYRGLLTVGAAGSLPPKMVILEYNPAKKGNDRHLCLLGKGVVFDSGGISIKPPADMWTMKGDMAGAAAVIYGISIIARKKPNHKVSAIICLAENLPDSRATRPGDIFTAANGKKIHVDNTDAEGRLILSDGLYHAGKIGATHIVDFATLTGACVVALGERIAGVMGNDDGFINELLNASAITGERLWRLPLPEDYRTLLDTPVADINNVGGRWGGAITAGLFLKEFVPDGVSWAHVDIAGPAFTQKKWGIYSEGATGFGVRIIDKLVH